MRILLPKFMPKNPHPKPLTQNPSPKTPPPNSERWPYTIQGPPPNYAAQPQNEQKGTASFFFTFGDKTLKYKFLNFCQNQK